MILDSRPRPSGAPRTHRSTRSILGLALASVPLLLPLAACGGGPKSNVNAATQLSFGVSMARRGLWQEALFRFREAERLDPSNPRVENNLGVAYEAAGNFDKALEYYKKALQLSPESREVKNNYTRFVEFYQGFRAKQGKPGPVKPVKIGEGPPAKRPSGLDAPPQPGGVTPADKPFAPPDLPPPGLPGEPPPPLGVSAPTQPPPPPPPTP